MAPLVAPLRELVDVAALQRLLESFSSLSGIASALLTPAGEILASSGWRRICTMFHRRHPTAAARCLESDTVLAGGLAPGHVYNLYRCRNGLVDVAIPVVVDGVVVANVFVGQFLLEAPDEAQFAQQADELGFDRRDYLAALAEVEVLPLARVEAALELVANLTRLLGEMGLERKRLLTLRGELVQRVEEQTAELRDESERLRALSEATFEGLVLSENGVIFEANEQAARIFGARVADLIGVQLLDYVTPEHRAEVERNLGTERSGPYEIVARTNDGRTVPVELRGRTFVYRGRRVRGTALRDLSERKAAQQEIRSLRSILPVCSYCGKIRDEEGNWELIETHISKHSQSKFSHGICNDCVGMYYPGDAGPRKP